MFLVCITNRYVMAIQSFDSLKDSLFGAPPWFKAGHSRSGFRVWVWGLGFGFRVWVWGLEFGFGV